MNREEAMAHMEKSFRKGAETNGTEQREGVPYAAARALKGGTGMPPPDMMRPERGTATMGQPGGMPGQMGGMPPPAAPLPKRMTRERLMEANKILKKYKAGKARLEARLKEDEKWWRGHAWDGMRAAGGTDEAIRPTKWLVNVIMGKHADMVDAYPEPVILPRERSDEREAKRLTSILPVVLEQNKFDEVYAKQAWEKNKHGTAAYAVYWDSKKLNGLGDVTICGIDLMNLFWEPGIEDIQKSKHLFLVSAQDKDALRQQYPQLRGVNMQTDFSLTQYQTEDLQGKSDKALVVDWYYHSFRSGRQTLEYCKYCGLEVLYASEDDPNMEGRAWYEDGEYPFVLDPLFPQKGSPAGWGYIDLGRGTQENIDLLDHVISLNARAGAIPRYFRKNDSAINLDQFMDFSNPVVNVEGGLGDVDMKPIQYFPLDKMYVQHLNDKIEELKQTCGNQDVSNGIASGVTAASGIAAQMEAVGRTSRDANKGTYRAYSRILEKVIERIRQFYDAPRTFRILGADAEYEYVRYDNSGLVLRPNQPIGGWSTGWRKPIFDIQMSAQKQNAYSKMAQNELALQLLSAGVFNPNLADQGAVLLSMMDFNRKEELLEKVRRNGMMAKMTAVWQKMAIALASRYEPVTADRMARAVLSQAERDMAPGGPISLRRIARFSDVSETPQMARFRERARSVSQPE
ncbi:MAG: hypothetical protein IKQ41_11780 [Clostridia bacterium]|nr:hypothetical protein [Clostridia bacterium]